MYNVLKNNFDTWKKYVNSWHMQGECLIQVPNHALQKYVSIYWNKKVKQHITDKHIYYRIHVEITQTEYGILQ